MRPKPPCLGGASAKACWLFTQPRPGRRRGCACAFTNSAPAREHWDTFGAQALAAKPRGDGTGAHVFLDGPELCPSKGYSMTHRADIRLPKSVMVASGEAAPQGEFLVLAQHSLARRHSRGGRPTRPPPPCCAVVGRPRRRSRKAAERHIPTFATPGRPAPMHRLARCSGSTPRLLGRACSQ